MQRVSTLSMEQWRTLPEAPSLNWHFWGSWRSRGVVGPSSQPLRCCWSILGMHKSLQGTRLISTPFGRAVQGSLAPKNKGYDLQQTKRDSTVSRMCKQTSGFKVLLNPKHDIAITINQLAHALSTRQEVVNMAKLLKSQCLFFFLSAQQRLHLFLLHFFCSELVVGNFQEVHDGK